MAGMVTCAREAMMVFWTSIKLGVCELWLCILNGSPLSLGYLNQAFQGISTAAYTCPPILGPFVVSFNFKFLEGELLPIRCLYTLCWDSCRPGKTGWAPFIARECPWLWKLLELGLLPPILGLESATQESWIPPQGPHNNSDWKELLTLCAHLLCAMRRAVIITNIYF